MAMRFVLAVVTTVCLPVAGASAAIITQTQSQAANAAGWNLTTIWSNGEAPSAAHDYVNNNAGYVLRTPEADNTTFAGNSLTVQGTLAMKSANNSSRTKTVDNLILDGGNISNFTSGANFIQTLAGNMTVLSNSAITMGSATEARHYRFTTAIGGSANLAISSNGGTGTYTEVTNAANSFTGLWALSSGILRFTNAGSVGAGDVRVAGGTLEIQHDWNAPGALLDVDGGTVALGTYNWTVGELTIGTSTLTPATYDVATLNGFGTGTFTGTGTVTVIPEPGTMIPAGLALLALASTRRRRPATSSRA